MQGRTSGAVPLRLPAIGTLRSRRPAAAWWRRAAASRCATTACPLKTSAGRGAEEEDELEASILAALDGRGGEAERETAEDRHALLPPAAARAAAAATTPLAEEVSSEGPGHVVDRARGQLASQDGMRSPAQQVNGDSTVHHHNIEI